ncbi:DUF429 domain-containing protein [Halobaculum sp. EA56]|uniref:DUF429 domain-containing protein n=1 Tax=Halobaculum sp. EA56 TaxID=3421648 RepID=UPI003EBE9E2A
MDPDPTPTAVYGVDFSAAERSAGASTWVARCVADGDALVVDDLSSASEFLGLDSTARGDVLPALADRLGAVEGPAVAGLDFPFGLPAWVLGDDDWRAFVEGTPDRWGVLGDVDGPRGLYDAVEAAAETDGRPRRRATDDEHGGQAPAGFRIKTQTYYGISVLLRRLVGHEGVAVPPVLPASEPGLTVLETYPASVFDRLPGADRTGYKGDQRRHVEARRRNVAALRDAGVRFGDDAARDCAVATDDALDAVAAAVAAARNYPDALDAEYGEPERLEARIYA